MDKDWQGRRVLVTGASGFIGAHLVRRLVDLGADVTGFSDYLQTTSYLLADNYVSRIRHRFGTIACREHTRRLVADFRPQVVFHLAAETQVRDAIRHPVTAWETNATGTIYLLEALRDYREAEAIVVASTDKVYGDSQQLPYTEDHPLEALAPYDVSKLCADYISRCYREVYGLPIVISRCGNVYGPGDYNLQRLIPGTIQDIHAGRRPRLRSNGTHTRDYLYIDDCVDGYLKMANYGGAHTVFNLAPGEPTSVLEVVHLILGLMGRAEDLQPILGHAAAKYEIQHQYLSAGRAAESLDWYPKYTLQAGLEPTIAWYKERFDDATGLT